MIEKIFLLMCLIWCWCPGLSQEISTRDFAGDKISVVVIANVYGDISVDGRNTTTITIGHAPSAVSAGEEVVRYKEINDTLIVYVQTKCNRLNFTSGKKANDWGYYDWVEDCEEEDPVHVDFSVTVPASIEVLASTINEGDIEVKNVENKVSAKNINGHIEITGPQIKSARTINGDLNLNFTSNPVLSGDYYTLNGNINASYAHVLHANLSFESFNGDFFTNSDHIKVLPIQVDQTRDHEGFHIEVGGKSLMQAGQGGKDLKFETFNGNVILKINSLLKN